MYLLDTCVFSEFTRPKPSPQVVEWAQSIQEQEQFLSVLVLGELLRGVAKLPEGFRKSELAHWVDSLFISHADRLIKVDEAVTRVWAQITAEAEAKGRPLPGLDGLIAASALAHGLTLVTRNAADFEAAGVKLLNPWG